MPEAAFLDIAGVSVRYGAVVALDDVSLHVAEGETVCLLGANGAGKTSLMRAVMGMVPVASGTVTMDGFRLTGRSVHRVAWAGVGMVPEGRMVFGRLSVRENLWRLSLDQQIRRYLYSPLTGQVVSGT